MNENAEQILANLDTLTKQGQRLQVLKALTSLLKSNPSRTLRPQLARLANRNHDYVLALRILHPIIREDREGIASATNEAINIYATSLMWIGALEEAQECLERVSGFTDALLTTAFVYFAQWEYQKSIPVLLKYVNSNSITEYQRLVGKINLLAAYIALGNIVQAKQVFDPLILDLKANTNAKILYGNCLELRAQMEILEHHYESALTYLDESEKCLADQPGRYLLYVNKWRALAQLGLSPNDSTAYEALAKVKAEATALKNWETIRDCDFHLARIQQDQHLMQKILLGTPYQGYHDRVRSIFSLTSNENKSLEYCPSEITKQPNQIGLDLNKISDTSFLNSTSWPLLQLMTKDIYRPPRMGVVFSALYKKEYFDPFTSPQRVRNSIFRFNDWAKKAQCEFRIRITDGDFTLIGPEGFSIATTQTERNIESWQASLKIFKVTIESRSFTTSQLATALKINRRSAQHILQKALTSKKVQKIGTGKNSRYIFFSGRRRSAAA